MKSRILPLLLVAIGVWGCSSPQHQPDPQSQRAFFVPSNWQQPIEKSATAPEPASPDTVGFKPVFEKPAEVGPELSNSPVQKDASGVTEFVPIFEKTEEVTAENQNKAFGKVADSEQMVGIASWYGPGFHGKKTANGEKYNQRLMTAAHKILPMNTWVQVTNLENNKTVVVRINDRGPYKEDRIIDLTQKAAERLDFMEKGTAKVTLKVLQYPKDYDVSQGLDPYKQVVVQIAVFRGQQRAVDFQQQLSSRYQQIAFVIDEQKDQTYHVIAGPYPERSEAVRIAKALKADGIENFVRSYRK